MADKPAYGSNIVCGIQELKDVNGQQVTVPIYVDVNYTPPRLIVELPDRALRDLGVVTVDGSVTATLAAGSAIIGKVGHDITGIADGRKVVTTAGTRVTLASTTACKRVDITAETDNTGIVVVGGTTCVAALATRQGIPLNPGDSYSLEIDDLADVNIDSMVNGDGVTFTYYT